MTINPTTPQTSERPVAPFGLSLIGGVLTLAESATTIGSSLGPPRYRGMMGEYHPGGGLMGGYYGMVQGFGFGGSWFCVPAAVGAISGVIILVGAVMVYNQPPEARTWGALMLDFSLASLFGMGGFLIGAVLGIVGGVLALTWKRWQVSLRSISRSCC